MEKIIIQKDWFADNFIKLTDEVLIYNTEDGVLLNYLTQPYDKLYVSLLSKTDKYKEITQEKFLKMLEEEDTYFDCYINDYLSEDKIVIEIEQKTTDEHWYFEIDLQNSDAESIGVLKEKLSSYLLYDNTPLSDYVDYFRIWIKEHDYIPNCSEPACFNEWYNNEYQEEDSENWTCSCGNLSDCVQSVSEWIETEENLTEEQANILYKNSSCMDSDFCENCWESYKLKFLKK